MLARSASGTVAAERAVLEQGPATKEDGSWWTYQTTTTASGNPKVLVAAEDLPGHSTELTKSMR